MSAGLEAGDWESKMKVTKGNEEASAEACLARGATRAEMNQIVKAYMPFVASIAKRYRAWGVPMDDLVQQGAIGLVKAMERFDASKECKLTTYASYWIRAELRDYVVRNYRMVRLGTTRSERKAIRLYRKETVPDAMALAEKSGMPLPRAKKLWPIVTAQDVASDALAYDVISETQDVDSPEETSARAELNGLVRDAFEEASKSLDEREQRIVQERVLSDEPLTLDMLGKAFGVSKERVRQLEVRAKQKLRMQMGHLNPHAA